MHTVLVFPPEWRCLHWPYLSLPSLTGYLRGQGHSVTQLDLNLEFFEHMTSDRSLRELRCWAVELFEDLDSRESLSPVQQKAYADLAWTALLSEDTWLEEVARTTRILRRHEDFYDLDRCWQSLMALDRFWSLLRVQMMDLGETDFSLATHLEESSAEVMAVVDDEARNPFLAYLRDVALPRILAEGPGLVGISLTGLPQLFAAATLGRLLKTHAPHIHVTMGGNACSFIYEDIVRYRHLFACFDSLVAGEGEISLSALIKALEGGGKLAQVPSLTYWDAEQIHSNPPAPPTDINSLPMPDYEGLPLDRYLLPDTVLSIASSRGCYWKRCAFCAQRENNSHKYRRRQVDLVVEDLKNLAARHNTSYFIFCDETVPPRTLAELGQRIPAAGLKVYWDAAARLEKALTPQVCQDLSAAGCTCLQFGLESANDRVLSVIDKGLTKELAQEILGNTAAAGILNRVSVIVGSPTETTAEGQETIDFILANDEIIHAVVSQPFALQRFTRIDADPAAYDVRPRPHPRKDLALVYDDFDKDSGMGREEAEAQSLQLWQEIYKRFPKFVASRYPEMVLYPAPFKQPHRRYGDGESPLPVQRPIEQPDDVARTGTADGDGDSYRPRLRRGITFASLRFDLAAIQKALRSGQWHQMKQCNAQESHIVIDYWQEKMVKVSPMVVQVLRRADGNTSLAAIANSLAHVFELEPEKAMARCVGVVKLYRNLLTVGDED